LSSRLQAGYTTRRRFANRPHQSLVCAYRI
jgi:hypothetical protein